MGAKAWQLTLSLLAQALWSRLHHLIKTEQISRRGPRITLRILQTLLPLGRRDLGQNLCTALEARGPVFIKLGQLLSTRPDILGKEVCSALRKLQDEIAPMATSNIPSHIAELLGDDAQAIAHIEPQPLASASIAQVHAGTLVGGEDIVIKVVRPDIEARIRADMSTLINLGSLLEKRSPLLTRLHLRQILTDQRQTMLLELDMFQEAHNQIQLRRNFAGSDLLYVPRVFGKFSRRRILVMERVYGPRIGDIEALKKAGVDFRVLAHKGVETFFTQVFEHNFFHADMHPGNIFVDIRDPADPRYIALDCAIIGSLSENDKLYLAQNIIAFFARDYLHIAKLHLRSGWVPADTDVHAFAEVIKGVCEPIFAQPLSQISFSGFMTDLLQTAAEFDMEIQPQLALLQKTLLYVEGLGRQLYPDLDLWETAEPFMQRWAVRHLGPLAMIEQLVTYAPQLLREVHRLKEFLDDDQRSSIQQQLLQQRRQIAELSAQIKGHQHRRAKALIGVTLAAALLGAWALLST